MINAHIDNPREIILSVGIAVLLIGLGAYLAAPAVMVRRWIGE